ncbi:MAG: hypothetical protein GXO23_06210 [Crenarchaeota archaeon]|nr:hypothetical protein [Thermoproteota archaeon]
MSLSRMVKHVSIFQALKPIVGPSSSHTTAPFITSFLVHRLIETGLLSDSAVHHVEIVGREKGDLPYRGHRTFGAIVAGFRGVYFDDEVSLSREILESSRKDPDKLEPRVIYVQTPEPRDLEGAAFKLCFVSRYGDTILESFSLGGGTVELSFWDEVLEKYLRGVTALDAVSSVIFDPELESRRGIPLWLYVSFGALLSELCDSASRYFGKNPDELSALVDERQRLYTSFNRIVKNAESECATLHEYILRLEERLLKQDLVRELLRRYVDIVIRSESRCYDVLKSVNERVREVFYVLTISVDDIDSVRRELMNVASNLRGIRNVMFYAFITMLRVLSSRIILSTPTAGSAGILPAVLCTLYDMLGRNRTALEEVERGLVVAGIVNAVAANRASTSGSLHGCQAEIGVALGMAAAAYAYVLSDYNAKIAEKAAVLAMRSLLGLPCDPVLGSVEIPCIERNIVLSEAAITAAKLALSGMNPRMSLDNVIDAIRVTGQLLPQAIKEQAYGPLSCIFLSERSEELMESMRRIEDKAPRDINDLVHRVNELLKVISSFVRQAEWG